MPLSPLGQERAAQEGECEGSNENVKKGKNIALVYRQDDGDGAFDHDASGMHLSAH